MFTLNLRNLSSLKLLKYLRPNNKTFLAIERILK